MKIIEFKGEITETGKFAIITYEDDNGQTFTKREEYDKAITDFKRTAIEVTDKLGENFYQLALLADVQQIKTEYSSLAERFNKFAGAKYDGRLHIETEQILLRTYANMLAIRKAVSERGIYVLLDNVILPDGFLDYFKSQKNCQWLFDDKATTEQPATIEDGKFIRWYGTQRALCQELLDGFSEDVLLSKAKVITILRMELPKFRIEKQGKWTALDPVSAYDNWRKTGTID